MNLKIILTIFLIGLISNILSIHLNENDLISNEIKIKRRRKLNIIVFNKWNNFFKLECVWKICTWYDKSLDDSNFMKKSVSKSTVD